METKKCTSCNNELPATKDNFHAQKNGRLGLRSVCKPCIKIYRKKYTSTEEFKKYHREKQAKWRKENPEKCLMASRKSYKLHGHKRNEKRKERLKNDPEFRAKLHERERKYKESGRRHEVQSTPEQREKARLRSKKRRENPAKKKHDYEKAAAWRKENKIHLDVLHKKNREGLSDSYVAQALGVSVKGCAKELIEIKRTIIKIKRELKNNNVKIR